MTDEEQRKHDVDVVDKALQIVMDHFDAATVIAVRLDDRGEYTRRVVKHRGLWWANYGVIHGWLVEQDAILRRDACKEEEDDV